MRLYMTELVVSDLAASLTWYRDRLGLRVLHLDEPNGFALLRGGDGGRLALKAGVPQPGGARLHFEVADLGTELARLGAADAGGEGEHRGLPAGGPPRPGRVRGRSVRVGHPRITQYATMSSAKIITTTMNRDRGCGGASSPER